MKESLKPQPIITNWKEFLKFEDINDLKYRRLIADLGDLMWQFRRASSFTNVGEIDPRVSNFVVLNKMQELDIKSFNTIIKTNVNRLLTLSCIYRLTHENYLNRNAFDLSSKKLKLNFYPQELIKVHEAINYYVDKGIIVESPDLIGNFDPRAIQKGN